MAIVLVFLSLARDLWRNPQPVFRVCMAVTLVFGVLDGITATGVDLGISGLLAYLPMADKQMGWLLPVVVVLAVMTVRDRWSGKSQTI